MHAFDTRELDVGRRGGSRDEGHRPAVSTNGGGDPLDGHGHVVHDLLYVDDTEVVIGNKSQRPPALASPAIEDDRPGLRDCEGATGQSSFDPVQSARLEAALFDEFDSAWKPRTRETLGHTEPRDASLPAALRYSASDAFASDARDSGVVGGSPRAEPLDDLDVLALSVCAWDANGITSFVRRDVSKGRPDSSEDLVSSTHCVCRRRRKALGAAGGRSRPANHAPSPGTYRVRPPRSNSCATRRASRWLLESRR